MILLDTLNTAWASTWNFHPIALETLLADLQGQREGMYVAAMENSHRLVGTVHALFNQHATNPDGEPYAWISNLTTDPALRGHGLGRMLLAVGINALRARGASSVALGVDGGAIAPMTLYRSVGFEAISTVEIWESPCEEV